MRKGTGDLEEDIRLHGQICHCLTAVLALLMLLPLTIGERSSRMENCQHLGTRGGRDTGCSARGAEVFQTQIHRTRALLQSHLLPGGRQGAPQPSKQQLHFPKLKALEHLTFPSMLQTSGGHRTKRLHSPCSVRCIVTNNIRVRGHVQPRQPPGQPQTQQAVGGLCGDRNVSPTGSASNL